MGETSKLVLWGVFGIVQVVVVLKKVMLLLFLVEVEEEGVLERSITIRLYSLFTQRTGVSSLGSVNQLTKIFQVS